jgi:PAS domain S-box-containing protein
MNNETKTILLVEDEALIAMSEAMTLEGYGYQVITVHSGEAAVEAVEKSAEIDLVLMDINLGESMDGTQAAEIILKQRDLPVIFLSSHTERKVVEKTEGITSYGYIVKNSGETVLLASIKMAFRLFEAKVKEMEKETALRESEERYRRLTELTPDAIYIHCGGRLVFTNPAGIRLLRASGPEQIIGKTVFDFIHPNHHKLATGRIRQLVTEGGKAPLVEERFVCLDGTVIDVEVAAIPFNYQGEPAVQVVVRDITERKRAEEALRKSEALYHDLVETLQDLIWQCDAEGRYTYLNPAWETVLGYSLAEMVGRRFADFQSPTYTARDSQEFAHLLQGGSVQNYETMHLGKDGREIPLIFNATSVCDEQGQVIGTRGIAYDISERKRAETALQNALQEKQTLLQELQHRAKNSFAMISSMISLTANASQVDEVKSALSEVGSRVRAMAELYDLLYATDAVTEVRLDRYCARITAYLQLSESIHFTQTYDAVTVPVKTAAAVGMILTELITNAIKHAFPGSGSGTISISLRHTDGGVVIQIEDEGVEPPKEFDTAASNSLGLKLVQVLVQQIGGSFKLEHAGETRRVVEFPLEG